MFKTEKASYDPTKDIISGLSVPAIIEPIDYSGKPIEFDFFKSLYRHNWKDIENCWYIDDDGNHSELVPTFEEYKEGLSEHIRKTIALYCTKKPEWKPEDELRAVLYDTLEEYEDGKNRCFKYDFSALEGIIFGIKTSMSDKREIIRRVYSLCEPTKRADFKFYQARYDRRSDKIIPIKIRELGFSFESST